MCLGASAVSASAASTSSHGRKIADGPRSHEVRENNRRARATAQTLQSKASAPGGLKNPSRSFAPWRAEMRRLWRKRSFAERIKCKLGTRATTAQSNLREL